MFLEVSWASAWCAMNEKSNFDEYFRTCFALVWELFQSAAQSIGCVKLIRIGYSKMFPKAWNCCSSHFRMVCLWIGNSSISILLALTGEFQKMTCTFKITKWFNENANEFKQNPLHSFILTLLSLLLSLRFVVFQIETKIFVRTTVPPLKWRSMPHKCYTRARAHTQKLQIQKIVLKTLHHKPSTKDNAANGKRARQRKGNAVLGNSSACRKHE